MCEKIEDALLKIDKDGILLSLYISLTLFLALPSYSAYTVLKSGIGTYYPLPVPVVYALIILLPVFAISFRYLGVWPALDRYAIANRVKWEVGAIPPPPRHLFLFRLLSYIFVIAMLVLMYYYFTSLLLGFFKGWGSIFGIVSNLLFITQIILIGLEAHSKTRKRP